jgi:hypothetical protein
LPALRQAIAEHRQYFKNAGNLSLMSQQMWFQLLTKNDLFLRETVEQELAKLRKDLESDNPTPLEKLAVGQVVSCFLQMRITDVHFAASLDQPESTRKELMKRQEFAQRRFTDSVAQLEKLQRRRPVGANAPKLLRVQIATRYVPAFPRVSSDRDANVPVNRIAVAKLALEISSIRSYPTEMGQANATIGLGKFT